MERKIRDCLAGGVLAARVDDVLAVCRPCVELVPHPVPVEELPLGASSLGGPADLPVEAEWPLWRGEPQSLVAQIRLQDVAGIPGAELLPDSGWLTFFYTARQDTWGFDPEDRGSWMVLYFGADAPLVRRNPPGGVPPEGVYPSCRLDHRSVPTLPPWESPWIGSLRLTDEELDAYWELLDTVGTPPVHQLGGHPDQIQPDMTVECELVSRGVYMGDAEAWSDASFEERTKNRTEWRLLLQVGSDERTAMMWGDSGSLFFWIREHDLAARAFKRTWLILQCH